MRIGIILIGDELLSGKRTDKHLPRVIEMLDRRGLELHWCRMIGDDPVLIADTLRQTFATGDLVLSFGGIGATPDDRTREAAAEAVGAPLALHPEAVAILRDKFGERLYPQRIRMAEFPQGAELVPNAYNRVPGFSLEHHYFLPGFPEMAWPMAEWVLDERYAHLPREPHRAEYLVRVYGRAESDMVPLMDEALQRFGGLRLASLPHIDAQRPWIEFGFRAREPLAREACEWFCARLDEAGVEWQSGGQRGDG
ncbi:MAG TPA: molybdopterin-binding protein [Gammaproteobacteria bacterium]|nr:molybdopterin-binding protein [Gammaproteobacteria bacterium]